MQFIAQEVLYRIGQNAVTIVTQNELGGLTNVETTQAALQARAPAGAAWSDAEVQAEALAGLTARFGGTHEVLLAPAPTPLPTVL